jgi:hypothetical protein
MSFKQKKTRPLYLICDCSYGSEKMRYFSVTGAILLAPTVEGIDETNILQDQTSRGRDRNCV